MPKTKALHHLFSPWAVLFHWLMSLSTQQMKVQRPRTHDPFFPSTEVTLKGICFPSGDALIISASPIIHVTMCLCLHDVSHLQICTFPLTIVLMFSLGDSQLLQTLKEHQAALMPSNPLASCQCSESKSHTALFGFQSPPISHSWLSL